MNLTALKFSLLLVSLYLISSISASSNFNAGIGNYRSLSEFKDESLNRVF